MSASVSVHRRGVLSSPPDGPGVDMQPTMDDAAFSVGVDRAPQGAGVTVRVAGDVDLTTAEELERAVREQLASAPVMLDLSGVTFMDSSGLRALDALVRHARADGRELRIATALPESVAQILELTGMMQILPMAGA